MAKLQTGCCREFMTTTMTSIASSLPVPEIPAVTRDVPQPLQQSTISAHMDLGKVRLNAMVVFTTALGFVVGSQTVPHDFNWLALLWTCTGTFLAAMGASSFNKAIEARRDAKMHRTRKRPLCTGRLTRTYAAAFGLVSCMMGIVMLVYLATPLAAVLAAANVIIYALLYTPLKPVATVNTLVGAIVGGIPPMLGWAAATGSLDLAAYVLGGILFIWQIPHFLALCWIYREDYARGGFKMLPITDRTGRRTSGVALIYAVLLMPLCLFLALLRHDDLPFVGIPFVALSFLLTLGMILCALHFAITRANQQARRLFFASIIYLPLLAIIIMFDAVLTRGIAEAGHPPGVRIEVQKQDSDFVDPARAPAQSPVSAAPTAVIAAPASK